MCLRPVLVACLLAGPAMADTVAETGYAVGCDPEGASCLIVSRGFNLTVTRDGGTPAELFETLSGLPKLTAVSFEGSLGEMGDSSADLVLSALREEPDDLYQGNLQAMQGMWQPVGEETPFYIIIDGMDWTEVVQEEVTDVLAMTVGEDCGSGVRPGNGMAITLYRYGDDPGDDACWRLEYVDDATLELRDFKGDQGAVTFARLP
jgi:hypothetical protein